MRQWLEAVLRSAEDEPHLVVILDEDCVVSADLIEGDVIDAGDWWQLRSAYERDGRRRPRDQDRLVFVVRGPHVKTPLPWDIEQAATVISVRLPGPPNVRQVIRGLDDDESERVLDAIGRVDARQAEAALLEAVSGVPIRSRQLALSDQLRLAARIATRTDLRSGVNDLAREYVTDSELIGLLAEHPDVGGLQGEWEQFVNGAPSPAWSLAFENAHLELGELFAGGLLSAAVPTTDLPAWALVGARQLSNEEKASDLLDQRPQPFPPNDTAGWFALARWWADIRRLTAFEGADLRAIAWQSWAEIDEAFLDWLRQNYGAVLSSSARWPGALHRVAGHLARRLGDGEAERVLLVVLDGLGLAQWAHLRERLAIRVIEDGATFALIPTYTTVSRQAIFAGELPVGYPNSLWTTAQESRHWEAFWRRDGIDVTGVVYHRVKGRFPHDRIEFGAARAVGVVVNAVDELMHTSELLGDAQLLANLDAWATAGFLNDLVGRAAASGFEIWVTADHGNLECQPVGVLSEGAAIELAGKRLQRYPNRSLRDASRATGIVWDGIPGMPHMTGALRFAEGRTAYTNSLVSISHGGLSIDEVIVPLARVEA